MSFNLRYGFRWTVEETFKKREKNKNTKSKNLGTFKFFSLLVVKLQFVIITMRWN